MRPTRSGTRGRPRRCPEGRPGRALDAGGVSRRRRGVALLAAVGIGAVSGCALFEDEVGPEAEQIAEDPLLHIEVDGAEPEGIETRTGTAGGVAPALVNSESRSSRTWAIDTHGSDDPGSPAGWEQMLVGAVEAGVRLDVTYWGLRCLHDRVAYDGVKPVSLDGDTQVMYVSIAMHLGSRPALRVELESGEGSVDPDAPPPQYSPPIRGDCPQSLVQAFEATQG